MKKRAVRAAVVLIEAAAVLIAVIAAGAAFLYWRMEQGPVSLALFKPSVTGAIEQRLPANYDTEIEAVSLMTAEGKGAYAVRLSGVRIIDGEGRETARAAQVDMTFAPGDFFAGKIGPRRIDAAGARFSIERDSAQIVKIPGVGGKTRKSPMSFLSPVIEGKLFRSAFESAEMNDAEVVFRDIASGRSWITRDADVFIRRRASALQAAVKGEIDLDGVAASIDASAQYTEQSGVITLDIDGEHFPIGDILTMFYGEQAAVVDAPVSGSAVVALTSGGDVLSSSFTGRLENGFLRTGAKPTPFQFIEWETLFDPKENAFTIERFAFDINGASGVVSGEAALQFGKDVRDPKALSFRLESSEMTLNLPGFFAEALPVDSIALAGAYEVEPQRLTLSAIDASLLDVRLAGDFSMATAKPDKNGAAPSREIFSTVKVEGALDPERLLKLWPLGPARGVRDWVNERLETATIENIEAKIDLPFGAVEPGKGLPEDGLTIEFDVSGAKAFYVPQMTPLTGASGHGIVKGNSFFLSVDRGRIGKIAVSDGEVDFPAFTPQWQPTYYRFSAVGASEEMLTVLNQEPLRLLSKINLSPEQFRGDAKARFEIMRPNKRDVASDEYRYSGKATFENMLISGVAGDVDLVGGKGDVDLKPRSVTISADASVSDAPVRFVWRQNFFKEDGPSQFDIEGTVDASTADLFGVSSRQYLRGPVDLKARAIGTIGAFSSLDVEADFSNAAASLDALGWGKPAGAAAKGSFRAAFSQAGASVEDIRIEGEGIDVLGKAAFRDGGLAEAAFPKFYLDGVADLAVTSERNSSGALAITAVGDYLNAAALVERSLKSGGDDEEGSPWGAGLTVTARIDRLNLREGVEYGNASLDLWRGPEQLEKLDFAAFDANDAPFIVKFDHAGDARSITATTSELGDLLKGVFGVRSIRGGEGLIKINLSSPERKGISGTVAAQNIHVVDAPLLARVFSAGSLDGLNNLMNGEGIDFAAASGKFDLKDGVFSVNEFRATGTSVGLTADGAMALGDGGEVSLSGAVAPVYQLNSVLGAAPVIGDILVGKKGEGVLAVSYLVNGRRTAPNVVVNPLSALTPGIFRQIFEPSGAAPKPAPAAVTEEPAGDPAP